MRYYILQFLGGLVLFVLGYLFGVYDVCNHPNAYQEDRYQAKKRAEKK